MSKNKRERRLTEEMEGAAVLKCNIKTGGRVWVKASGTADNLVPEVGMVILEIYRAISKKNPEEAKKFKNRLIGLLLDPDSPVWKEGNHET